MSYNKLTYVFLLNKLMSGMIFETAMCKFISKVYIERHNLCLIFIMWSCENGVS